MIQIFLGHPLLTADTLLYHIKHHSVPINDLDIRQKGTHRLLQKANQYGISATRSASASSRVGHGDRYRVFTGFFPPVPVKRRSLLLSLSLSLSLSR